MSNENLNTQKVIDWDLYKLYNPDLPWSDHESLANHYQVHGRFEKRRYKHVIPEDFDVVVYRLMNSELSDLSDEELKKHYTIHGKEEQRPYKLTDSPMNKSFKKRSVADIKIPGITFL